MSYFIVDKNSGKKYRKPAHYSDASFTTERGAKISLTRLLRTIDEPDNVFWVVMSSDEYREKFPVKMVERTNLMSGQKYMEAEDTPNCCSPASERYWSM